MMLIFNSFVFYALEKHILLNLIGMPFEIVFTRFLPFIDLLWLSNKMWTGKRTKSSCIPETLKGVVDCGVWQRVQLSKYTAAAKSKDDTLCMSGGERTYSGLTPNIHLFCPAFCQLQMDCHLSRDIYKWDKVSFDSSYYLSLFCPRVLLFVVLMIWLLMDLSTSVFCTFATKVLFFFLMC